MSLFCRMGSATGRFLLLAPYHQPFLSHELCYRPFPAIGLTHRILCLCQYFERGRVSPMISKLTHLILHLHYTADFILPTLSILCGGESSIKMFKHLILRLCDLVLDYSTNFTLPALSIRCGGGPLIKTFTHLILRLCYLGFRLLCGFHLFVLSISCGGEPPIKRFTHLILRFCSLDF